RALQLQAHILEHMPEFASRLSAGGLQQVEGSWNIIINATSSSLGSTAPDLPASLYASGALAYDMVYAGQDTPFMMQANEQGAARTSDGLGMLVGQAAASYALWHGIRPEMSAVLKALR